MRWRWPAWLASERAEAELDEEIRSHIDGRAEELVAQGLPVAEAREQARREFGGIEQVKERCRDERPLRWLEVLWSDLRYGARWLRRSPGFTLAAVASLAIGIGANTAIFSVADAALLRPLPVRDPDRLVELIAAYPDGHRQTNLPAPVFETVRRQSVDFAEAFAQVPTGVRLRVGSEPSEAARALFVSGNYFAALDPGAARGRLLEEYDDRAGSPRTVVLSHRFWMSRFGGDPGVAGRAVWVDGAPATIVGVAAAGFFGVDRSFTPQVYLPLSAEDPTVALWILARLHPGVSSTAARSRIASAYRDGLRAMRDEISQWPEGDRQEFLGQRVELHAAGNGTAGLRWQVQEPLRVLGTAVLLVLLITCSNVAALQLSQGERRIPEIAVRLSMGGSRGRILRQLLTESTLLALLGGAVGLGLGLALHSLLRSLSALDPSATIDFQWDWRVLSFTLGVSTLAGLLTGLSPALRLGRVDARLVLSGNRAAGGGWRSGPRRAILVAQVAATLALLIGASLLLRSLAALAGVETGFDQKNVLIVQVDPSGSGFAEAPSARWSEPLAERIATLPGVRSAATAGNTVFTGHESWIVTAWVDGHEYRPGERQVVGFNEVGPAFFRTAGIPLLAGREFRSADGPNAPAVAIVNRTFARKYFGDANPLGRRFGTAPEARRLYEIVGVVADVKVQSLRESPWPAVYLAALQQERPGPAALHLRVAAPPAALASAIRREAARLDPGLEVRSIETLEQAVSRTLRRERMLTTLLMLFAGVTLLLTAVGLYGTMSYAVARRTGELGIRMALGATRARVVVWMLREAAAIVLAGATIGLVVAAWAVPSLRTLVFQVPYLDPLSFGAALVAVVVVGLTAALVPAWRAAASEPLAALRHE
jgi:predicted permease